MTTFYRPTPPAEAPRPRPVLYRVLWGEGLPVMHRGAGYPAHADCLRYDLGCHHPIDVSLCVFPTLRHVKHGSTGRAITTPRWESHGFKLVPVPVEVTETDLNLMEFRTYRSTALLDLVPKTLAELMTDTDYEAKIYEWR